MRLAMAVSADGYLARGPEDDMRWLGPWDKAAFRILTGVGGVLGVSRRSRRLMPETLQGREVLSLSSGGLGQEDGQFSWGTVSDFGRIFPDGWLLGGPTLALHALEARMVREVHLCRSERRAFPEGVAPSTTADPYGDFLTPFLEGRGWSIRMKTRVGDTTVEVWRRGP